MLIKSYLLLMSVLLSSPEPESLVVSAVAAVESQSEVVVPLQRIPSVWLRGSCQCRRVAPPVPHVTLLIIQRFIQILGGRQCVRSLYIESYG